MAARDQVSLPVALHGCPALMPAASIGLDDQAGIRPSEIDNAPMAVEPWWPELGGEPRDATPDEMLENKGFEFGVGPRRVAVAFSEKEAQPADTSNSRTAVGHDTRTKGGYLEATGRDLMVDDMGEPFRTEMPSQVEGGALTGGDRAVEVVGRKIVGEESACFVHHHESGRRR